jgi:hypothetical protein
MQLVVMAAVCNFNSSPTYTYDVFPMYQGPRHPAVHASPVSTLPPSRPPALPLVEVEKFKVRCRSRYHAQS